MNKEIYLIVSDSPWMLRYRAMALLGISGIVAYQPRVDPGSSTFYWSLTLLFATLGIATVLSTFNPQTRLIIDKTGIWTTAYETVEWQQLVSFYSSEYNGTEEMTACFVFVTVASQNISISLDAADTDADTIRQFIKQLNTNPMLLDHGRK